MTMHAGQLEISARQVRELIAQRFPQWRELPVTRFDSSGTVNAVFRVGDSLTARFLLQPQDPAEARRALESEAAAARELAAATRFPVPETVVVSDPGAGYPLPWSVQTWLPGVTGFQEDPARSAAFGADLGEFIRGVRQIDVRGRKFSGRYRGGDLHDHDEWLEECFTRSAGILDVPRLRKRWARFRDLPRESPDVMSHGDLMPGNVLVADGRLAGVLDIGTYRAADPALDLVCAWNLLDDEPRQVLRETLKCDDLTWERGQAWALEQAMGLTWYYQDSNPVMSRLGRVTLERILSAGPG